MIQRAFIRFVTPAVAVMLAQAVKEEQAVAWGVGHGYGAGEGEGGWIGGHERGGS